MGAIVSRTLHAADYNRDFPHNLLYHRLMADIPYLRDLKTEEVEGMPGANAKPKQGCREESAPQLKSPRSGPNYTKDCLRQMNGNVLWEKPE